MLDVIGSWYGVMRRKKNMKEEYVKSAGRLEANDGLGQRRHGLMKERPYIKHVVGEAPNNKEHCLGCNGTCIG